MIVLLDSHRALPLLAASGVALFLLAAYPSHGAAQDEFDVERLNGNWKPKSGMFGGQALPAASLEAMTLKIEDGTYVVETNGIRDSGKLEYELSATPMQMNIVGEDGPNKGRTIAAIFKMDGEKLIICYNVGGDERPTEFETPRDSQLLLMEYMRSE